ncbi:hypothetical protein Clacol_000603 [Clathrus columnatus]|uniref:Uncharacterized protein n=1 Tax=Clathrus columnatus TaxID=1419009 RepID=A0AAV4ZYT6_9AGAM|nr:hypothetical protein Clacol_000603 [Clathrus columnatus]
MGDVLDYMSRSTKPTQIVWGSVAGLLTISIIIAFVFVRWNRRRNYRPVLEEAFIHESLVSSEDNFNLVLYISPTNFANLPRKRLGDTSASYSAAASSDSLIANPRLSNAFDETSDSSDRRVLSKSGLYSPRSYTSTSASSYSTRIISSGIWRTSLQNAFLSKPIYHALRHSEITFPLAGGRLTGFRPASELTSQKAEYIDPFSPFPSGKPERLSRHTSTLTNLSLHIPHASSSFLEVDYSKENLEPSMEEITTATESEEVVFYSAAKSQTFRAMAYYMTITSQPPCQSIAHSQTIPNGWSCQLYIAEKCKTRDCMQLVLTPSAYVA